MFIVRFAFILLLASTLSEISALAAKLRDRNTKDYRLICYYGAWANYRPNDGRMIPSDFDVDLCTHLVYGFAVLRNDQITAHDIWMDLHLDGVGYYKKFVELRKKNPGLTTLIAIGGWNEGMATEDLKYSKMAADPAKRKIFVQSVLDFLKKYDFDGLDFDWEYPVLREGVYVPEDKANFIAVLKELKEAFEPHGYLLTAAVAAGKSTLEAGYDIPQVSKYLDIINVMTYDFHGAWENYTGHNSPLYSRPDESDKEPDKDFNVDYAIKHWIREGADKKKMTLGMALYGRCYTLADENLTKYGDPVRANGTKGIFTGQEGMQGYNELCLLNKNDNWTSVWNEDHGAPYTYKGDQWCSYDDPDSIRLKVQYLNAMGLSGGMIWSIDTDDFRGRCYGTKFILLKTIVDELTNKTVTDLPKPPISRPHTAWLVDMDPPEPEKPIRCRKDGIFPIDGDCSKYLNCVRINENDFQEVESPCAAGTVFHPTKLFCDYPENVPECAKNKNESV